MFLKHEVDLSVIKSAANMYLVGVVASLGAKSTLYGGQRAPAVKVPRQLN